MAGRLSGIKFDSVRVDFLGVEPPRVLVSWELVPTAQDLKNLKFFIWRGESPNALEQLNTVGVAHNAVSEYMDTTGKLMHTQKVYYYQVKAVEFDSAGTTALQTFESEPTTNEGSLDNVGLYVADEHNFALRHVFGTPAFIYKKKLEGTYCPVCWDKILKRVTKSNCLTCFGTGKIGGYYPPMDAWMSFEVDPKSAVVAEWGVKQEGQTDVMFTNYPLLTIGDLINELVLGDLYRVINIRLAEKNKVPMLQIARVTEIKLSDIEQKIDSPDDRADAMLDQLDQRKKESEF